VLLAVTSTTLGDLAALRQQRLAPSVALALLTQAGLLSAAMSLPMTLVLLDAVTRPQTGGKLLPARPDTTFILWAFAPPVVLSLAALSAHLPARSRHGAMPWASGRRVVAHPILPASAARPS